jgi:hypothetical protein
MINTYALVGDANKKKAAIDYHVDHPDHIPHNNHGKSPIKKTSQDDGALPRKRKK